jgi:hypothetical protein
MPAHTSTPEAQLSSILACLTPTVTLLNELSDGLGTPFIQAISNTTVSLISAVQVSAAIVHLTSANLRDCLDREKKQN